MPRKKKRGPDHWPDMTHATTAITQRLVLRRAPARGSEVLEAYEGSPDRFGILERREIVVPSFTRGCWFASDWPDRWPAGANRVLPWPFKDRLGKLNYGALFAVFALRRGYLAILPLVGTETMAWLNVASDGRLVLNLGTLGTEPVACDAPLVAWGRNADLYSACRDAWAEALAVTGSCTPRHERDYPEIFRYLGWCSWEEYKTSISSDLLVDAVEQLERADVPVRYVLVDDGHLQHEERRLVSFAPNEKFPKGWKPLLRRRKADKVRWMGVWHNFNGYWRTVSPDNDFSPKLNGQLMGLSSGAILPRESPGGPKAFYDAFLGAVAAEGFDFVKIDDQATNLAWYNGSDNAVRSGRNCCLALQDVAAARFDGLINCMAHNAVCVFNTRNAVTRCSIDYGMGDAAKAKSHIWQSYANTLWLCQTVWGDHDMFHSCDPHTGRMMAVSKAMSGGPVYLSDAPADIVAERVLPLCYADGELLRPLAPAAPLPECACVDPMKERVAYRAIAPLPGGAAAIHVCNLAEPTPETPLKAAVAPADYRHASGMIQPYPGPWEAPKEGLVVYDWYQGTARKLARRHAFELDGFTDRLLLLCPIRKGWAVIGRPDKYLAPAAVEVLSVSKKQLKLRMAEAGPLALWCDGGTPNARGAAFTDRGNGLFVADLPVGQRDRTITISR